MLPREGGGCVEWGRRGCCDGPVPPDALRWPAMHYRQQECCPSVVVRGQCVRLVSGWCIRLAAPCHPAFLERSATASRMSMPRKRPDRAPGRHRPPARDDGRRSGARSRRPRDRTPSAPTSRACARSPSVLVVLYHARPARPVRRLRRRRRLLRDLRLPHHRAARPRVRADRHDLASRLLRPPGPADPARRDGRRWSAWRWPRSSLLPPTQCDADRAGHPRSAVYAGQLATSRTRRSTTRPSDSAAVTAPALLVAGRRGAVLPRLAAADPRRRAARAAPARARWAPQSGRGTVSRAPVAAAGPDRRPVPGLVGPPDRCRPRSGVLRDDDAHVGAGAGCGPRRRAGVLRPPRAHGAGSRLGGAVA